MLKIEATHFISWKHLEIIGIRAHEIFDIRHIYPHITLIKFYNKTPIKDRLENLCEMF